MLIDISLIGGPGGFSHIVLHIVAVPKVDPLTKGHILFQVFQRNDVFGSHGLHLLYDIAP